MVNDLKLLKHPQSQRLLRLGSEAGWVFAGQVVSLVGTLVGVRVITGYLSPSEYGVLGLSLTIVALYTEVVIGGLVGAFTRFYSIAAKADDVCGYVLGVRMLLIVAVSIAAVLFLVMTPLLLSGFEGLTLQGGGAVAVFATLFGSNAALNAVLNGARRRSLVALNSVVDAWLKIGLAVIAIQWFGSSATSVLTAYAASLVVVIAHQAYRVRQLRDSAQPANQRAWGREMFMFAWPASVWGIFTWAQMVADRWSLQVFQSTAEVGLYSVLLQLGFFPMSLLMGMVGTFLTPIFFQNTDSESTAPDVEQKRHWQLILLVGASASIVASLMAYGLKEWIFYMFVAAQYSSVMEYLPVMVLSGGLFGTGSLLSVRMMAQMRMIQLAKIMVGASLFGVSLIVGFSAALGLAGTVIAKLIFSFGYISWMAWVSVFRR